jgi:sialate O-acetylesterase
MKKYIFLIFILLFSTTTKILAINLAPNSLFSENAVFQRNVQIPIWGIGESGEKIVVEFNGQKIETVATNGKWLVVLKPMSEKRIPQNLIISGKDSTITIKNILIGEVWICSGQSNMERKLGWKQGDKTILNANEDIIDAQNFPQIRQFNVPKNPSGTKVDDVKSKWVECNSNSVKNFTAVGFYFARSIAINQHVPIGIIHSSVGGTQAEKWTDRTVFESNPALKSLIESYDKYVRNYPLQLEKYNLTKDSLLTKWQNDSAMAVSNQNVIPIKPTAPVNPYYSGTCGGLFNGMIAPLIPYAIKGVVWYQGESNSSSAKRYQTLFPAMIADWRRQWGIGDFPFLFVQVAPYRTVSPEIRESQLLSWKNTTNTAMVVTVDCGDSTDIHPINKRPVGERLALAARALAYKQNIVYSGPVYKSMKISRNKIELRFDFAGSGLLSKCGSLKGFVIAGEDKMFIPAKAIIKGKKIIVSSQKISKPEAVRMGWANSPDTNLFNKEELPASPFRTDNWETTNDK